MRRLTAIVLFLALLCLASASAQQLRVVTTQPDLADLASRIGGDEVDVKSLTKGHEDLHLVRVRPSLLVAVRAADLFLELGLDAEHAWVPPLLRAARNSRVAPGAPGFVNCSVGIGPLRLPTERTRAAGPDLHPRGNPHFNLDPENMKVVARTIRNALVRVRPASSDGFTQRLAAFESELDRSLERWRRTLAPFRGASFVEYHDGWIYFARRFGLEIVARLEPKPGVSPTPTHLAEVIRTARTRDVGVIVSRPSYADVGEKVAREAGATAVVLPLSSTTEGATRGYLEFMDHVVATFAAHLRKP